MRPTFIGRDVTAGCFDCNGSMAIWTAPNAQGVAARHHDATGHTTWCDVYMSVKYGAGGGAPNEDSGPKGRQGDATDA